MNPYQQQPPYPSGPQGSNPYGAQGSQSAPYPNYGGNNPYGQQPGAPGSQPPQGYGAPQGSNPPYPQNPSSGYPPNQAYPPNQYGGPQGPTPQGNQQPGAPYGQQPPYNPSAPGQGQGGYGGPQAPQGYGAPNPYQTQQQPWLQQFASPNDQLRQWFDSVDADRSGAVDANELRKALAAGGENFTSPTVVLMISMFDRDNSKTVNFDEFSQLFGYVHEARNVYNQADAAKQGLRVPEFKSALERMKFPFSEETARNLFTKQDIKGFGKLEFTDFLEVILRLGKLRTSFERMDYQRSGWVNVNFDMLTSLFASS